MYSSVALLLLIATTNADMNIGRWQGHRRMRRSNEHVIQECIIVTGEAGHYYYKTTKDEGPKVCGVYINAAPDRLVEVYFDYLDVPCNTGGLVAFIDGWELNGKYFPSEDEGDRPLTERVKEFCGLVRPKKVFISSQNAAQITYRVPKRGRGFSFTVVFLKNPTPCNVMVEASTELFTLRNYGKPSNCSLTALFPVKMSILSLGIGITLPSTNIQLETGTIRQCQEKGLSDYLEIKGGEDLSLSNASIFETLCGVDSFPDQTSEPIVCGVSSVKLVSSGGYDNSVTLLFRQAVDDDLNSANYICPL